jgi:hypothetical protein
MGIPGRLKGAKRVPDYAKIFVAIISNDVIYSWTSLKVVLFCRLDLSPPATYVSGLNNELRLVFDYQKFSVSTWYRKEISAE